MKEANIIRHLNGPNTSPFNRPRPLLYSSLSPEQKQIVAVARRKLSLPAKTAGGKLAGIATYVTSATCHWNAQCFWRIWEA